MQKLYEDSVESKVAWKYWLEERKFDKTTAEAFGVCYAPTNEFELADYLLEKKFSKEVLSKAGLFREKLRQGKMVSSFQGRLMIPIYEKLGRICGFTARKLSVTPEWGDKKAPKYINSPETTIFQKSQILFNLHLANKALKTGQDFILVEGQLDAIRCYIEGFETVIAPQGTAFTTSQADLLKKSNPRSIICLLDGDEAGRKAGLKYVSIFMESGLNARFASLPQGSDPDQILLDFGKNKLSEILSSSISMVQYVVENLANQEEKENPSIRKSICDFLFRSFVKVDSFVVKETFIKDLSIQLNVSNESIKKDFELFERQQQPKYQVVSWPRSLLKSKQTAPCKSVTWKIYSKMMKSVKHSTSAFSTILPTMKMNLAYNWPMNVWPCYFCEALKKENYRYEPDCKFLTTNPQPSSI